GGGGGGARPLPPGGAPGGRHQVGEGRGPRGFRAKARVLRPPEDGGARRGAEPGAARDPAAVPASVRLGRVRAHRRAVVDPRAGLRRVDTPLARSLLLGVAVTIPLTLVSPFRGLP